MTARFVSGPDRDAAVAAMAPVSVSQKRAVALGVTGLVVAFLLGVLVPVGHGVPSGPDVVPVVACREGMPCWECDTMGNGVCGPGAR